MKISVQNFGIISDAAVEIKGISLIAGPNDSGKSTIGKIFYSLIRGLNPDEDIFISEKNDSIRRFYQNILKILRDNKDIDISIYQTSRINDEWISKIESLAENFVGTQKKQLIRYCKFIKYQNDLEFNSIENKNFEIDDYFLIEFNDDIQPIFNEEKITSIFIEDLEGTATLQYNFNSELNKNINIFFNNSFFIESPSLIDKSLQDSILYEKRFSRDKKSHLKFALANESNFILDDENQINEIDKIIKIISEIINGRIVVDDFQGVLYEKNGQEINIDNVALGIKGFGLIQLLLKNHQLNSRTLLIIDEPEIHLHPNWQVLYAEILVLISKKLEIPILLTSHSPYFIEALKVFSEKYEYEEKTNFYFSQKSKDNLTAKIIDVSNDISPILMSISEAYFKISDIENE
jgi:ABC-type cobalamin/Fe3+-siderophores transport system ATPase subunit